MDRLLEKNWSVVMPDGDVSTVFWLRPDQQLSVLQVARQVNPERFRAAYEDLRRTAFAIGAPISLEGRDDHGSYYKFNLDAIALYSLLRLEEESPRRGDYIATYRTFRSIVVGPRQCVLQCDRPRAGRAECGTRYGNYEAAIAMASTSYSRLLCRLAIEVQGVAATIAHACRFRCPNAFSPILFGSAAPISCMEEDLGRIESPGIDLHPAVLDGPSLRSQLRSACSFGRKRRPRGCS